MRRGPLIAIGCTVVLVAAAAVPSWVFYQRHQDERARRSAAESFARAWQSGTLSHLAYAGVEPAAVASQTQQITASLTSASSDVPTSVRVRSVRADGDRASAQLSVAWSLSGGVPWRYDTTLPLRKASGGWAVAWTPAVVHPRLSAGQVLRLNRTPAERGAILGARDEVLVGQQQIVVVGLEPSRARGDVPGAARAIAALVGVDPVALTRRAAAAGPQDFVEVVRLRQGAYAALRDRLQPIPGAVFRQDAQPLAPSATFARSVLGRVGPAGAKEAASSGGRVRTGDLVGLSGLQYTYDAWLSGTSGVSVRTAEAASGTASTGTTSAGSAPAGTASADTASPVLFQVAPVAGKPLHVALDRAVQEAAEAALAGAAHPAALVALRPSTGEVLALGNGGPGGADYDRALLGQYPPGSTFKVVSSLALLTHGYTPRTPVACPATVNVGGKVFSNAENEVLGTRPFQVQFAQSCNTAFVGSASKVDSAALAAAARALGYGRSGDALGVNSAFDGSVPATADPVGHAAAMIGQGTVLASPLTVAGTAATVAAGRYLPPRLVLDTAAVAARAPATAASPSAPSSGQPPSGQPSSGQPSSSQPPSGQPAAGEPLPADAVAALRAMMREVVTSGTAAGTSVARAPGGPVYGKTGTAEYGTANPPLTHAWFTGFQGDLAFAVVVEDGGFGAKAAAPIAGDFLARLAR